MNYFAVVGRNGYWKYELEMIGAKNVKITKKNIVIFELEVDETGSLPSQGWQLLQCSQIIKWGQTMNKSDLFLDLEWTKIIGIDQKKYGTDIKKWVETVKRFKEIELLHSDLEIKKNGKEVICIDGHKDIWWVVRWYQDISLFEKVDFEKPLSGMKIGMMPSKLALFLVNLGVSKNGECNDDTSLTIRDPFAGFGTTGFVANHYWYDFIGSDLKITSLKGNWKWWNESFKKDIENTQKNREQKVDCFVSRNDELDDAQLKKTSKKAFFTVFKHDVLNPFKQNFLTNVDVIATEWRLGPILKNNRLALPFLQECQEKVWKVQEWFFDNLLSFFGKDKFPVISMTIPYYFQNKTSNVDKIRKRCQKSFLNLEILEDIYHRKGQLVGRQIIVIGGKV